MTEALENLIKIAPNINGGIFSSFLIVPTNEAYDGAWGKRYDNIIILAKLWGERYAWYKLCTTADVFQVRNIFNQQIRGFNLDIPTEYGVPRLWFDQPIEIDNLETNPSAIIGIAKSEEDEFNRNVNRQGRR